MCVICSLLSLSGAIFIRFREQITERLRSLRKKEPIEYDKVDKEQHLYYEATEQKDFQDRYSTPPGRRRSLDAPNYASLDVPSYASLDVPSYALFDNPKYGRFVEETREAIRIQRPPEKSRRPEGGMTPDRDMISDRSMSPDRGMISDRSMTPDRGRMPDRSMTPEAGRRPERGRGPGRGKELERGRGSKKIRQPENELQEIYYDSTR